MAVDKDIYKQILVTFTHEQVQKIETFWHENKLKNRNEAIRMLVEKGYVIKNDLTLFLFFLHRHSVFLFHPLVIFSINSMITLSTIATSNIIPANNPVCIEFISFNKNECSVSYLYNTFFSHSNVSSCSLYTLLIFFRSSHILFL
jgi:hypothetical protein